MHDVDIPPDLRSMVSNLLNSGERVMWQGRPVASRFMMASIPFILFGSIFTVVGIVLITVMMSESWGLGLLIALPCFLMGFGGLTSPIWLYRNWLKSVYVITDRRAICVVHLAWSLTVDSYTPAQLGNLTRRERADGSGDLIFVRREKSSDDEGNQLCEFGFLGVPDVRRVEQLVAELIRQAS